MLGQSGVIDYPRNKFRGAPPPSAPEGELGALVNGTKIAVTHRGLSEELGQNPTGPTPIYEDNTTTLAVLTGLSGKSQHLLHRAQLITFVAEYVRQGIVDVIKVGTENQAADNLTKNLGPTKTFAAAPLTNGHHPEIVVMQRRVLQKFRRERARAAEEERQDDFRPEVHTWDEADLATEVGYTNTDECSELTGRIMACTATLREADLSPTAWEQEERRGAASTEVLTELAFGSGCTHYQIQEKMGSCSQWACVPYQNGEC
jgi:hypothetical protein